MKIRVFHCPMLKPWVFKSSLFFFMGMFITLQLTMITQAEEIACITAPPLINTSAKTVSISSWYSRGRGDNFATTRMRIRVGCRNDFPSKDYGFVRFEGEIWSPYRPQPKGMIPLFSWRSSRTDDYWTTTQHADKGWRREGLSPDNRFVRLEGYVYPPSHGPRKGLVPLYSWYSPSRNDNWITSQHAGKGRRGESLSPDYRFVRLEGYAKAPPT